MNTNEYQKLLEKYPNLTAHGFADEVDPKMGLT